MCVCFGSLVLLAGFLPALFSSIDVICRGVHSLFGGAYQAAARVLLLRVQLPLLFRQLRPPVLQVVLLLRLLRQLCPQVFQVVLLLRLVLQLCPQVLQAVRRMPVASASVCPQRPAVHGSMIGDRGRLQFWSLTAYKLGGVPRAGIFRGRFGGDHARPFVKHHLW